MNEKLQLYIQKVTNFWTERSSAQKSMMIGGVVLAVLLISVLSYFSSHPKMVPLYSNLTIQEVGQVKQELEARAIQHDVGPGGTTILVPEDSVDSLLVDLAAVGLPNTGHIDYSYFSQDSSWGTTDSEFEMVRLDATQTELANLITQIDGISKAKVMINQPANPVFISDVEMESSASIVIHTDPGFRFDPNQIQGLYRLVSKSVPNLPTENIVIMNQNFEYFDLEEEYTSGNTYATQQQIKKDVEKDIQRRVQQMLSTMIGQEKVMVSVTADIDFTQENRVENIVEPVNLATMEGLPVSVERIRETYSGNPPVGGVAGTGDEDVPNYNTEVEGDNGSYELVKETINNEFTRITKNIQESPYKVRDLGIQVAVDHAKMQQNGEEIQYLSEEEQETVRSDITSILSSIVSTSVSKDYGEVIPDNKISIVFQEFNGRTPVAQTPPAFTIPYWIYVVGGGVLLLIVILIGLLLRRRKNKEEEIEEFKQEEMISIPEIDQEKETDSTARRKQLERLAKDKPEDFAKLLRSWIAED
ncbi:flagellar basal-body MS-ring/collar protein FliF [Bacillaceae bacterium S4-13-58]